MHLELDGKGPLHAQLTRALKAAMLNGRLAQGSRLPATRALARELELSRNTVLAAYEQLHAEGYLHGRVGSGSYVATTLPAARPGPPATEKLGPQSEFSRRGRRYHDHGNMPGRRIDGARYLFQYGVPFVNPALTSAWARELAHAAAYTSPAYPMAQGLPALREAVCDYLARRRGVTVPPDNVLIVAGTQQALALTARVVLDPGNLALLEEPHYFAMREQLQVHGAQVQATPVDRHGLQVARLPRTAPRLVCVTPSHQFPTGAVMSLERRLELIDYAHRHQAWIFEDDYDGEFRYDVQPLAALRALDEHERVIYVGTFSKAMFPSLRLGYLVMPSGLREDYITAKWQDDFGTSAVEQAAMARFMAGGGFERHLRRTWKMLKQRREVLMQGLRRCAGDRIEVADSRAGMHLVVWLRDCSQQDCDALIARARQLGLGLYSIAPFYLGVPDRVGLLFGYCGLSVAEIEEALVLFERCLDEVFPLRRGAAAWPVERRRVNAPPRPQ